MAHKIDVTRIRDELVQAFKWGDEDRVRVLIPQLGPVPKEVRAALDSMLEDPDSLVRQAAAFGLGELGGVASIKRLEQQLAIEEARNDYDGDAVVGDIVRALGHIEEAGARTSLIRRLERLAARKVERSDIYEIAHPLWRKRHSDLIAPVRRSLEQLTLPAPHGLHGLLTLLEKSPEELRAWGHDPTVPIEDKKEALAVLKEDVPDTLIPILPAFISTAERFSEQDLSQNPSTEYYCESVLRLLLRDRERLLTTLPGDARSVLRTVALRLIRATFPNPSISAAVVLEIIGRPEDASFLEAHSPEYPTLAKVFRDAAQTLRNRH